MLFSDPIDTVWVEIVSDYQGKKVKSIVRGDVELGSEDEKKEAKEKLDQERKDMAAMLGWMGTNLDKKVKEVRVSNRLTNSPACIISDEHDPNPAMEKILRSMGQAMPDFKRILEINPEHQVIKRLHELYSEKGDDEELRSMVELIYDQAVLAEGGELSDPSAFAAALSKVMSKALG